jgi:hypothetical protein
LESFFMVLAPSVHVGNEWNKGSFRLRWCPMKSGNVAIGGSDQ